MSKRWTTGVAAMLIVAVIGGVAHAAYWNPVDVTLRDSAADVLKSDGDPVYAGNGEDYSAIFDREAPSAQSGSQDVFLFQVMGRRDYVLQSPEIEGGAPLTCDETWSRVSFFSRVNQDWFTTLQTLPPGSPLTGDSGLRCWANGNGADYYIDYPGYQATTGAEPECVTVTRTDGSTYAFEAPATCLADVYELDGNGPSRTGMKIDSGVSLPFKLTAVLEPTR